MKTATSAAGAPAGRARLAGLMLRRACGWLFVSLALPPMGQHAMSFVLAEVLPFRGPEALQTISLVMVLVHLLLATPLALLALPGAWVLAREAPRAPAARPMQAGAVLFAVLVLLTLLARFVTLLPYQPLREVTDMTRLALGLGAALLLGPLVPTPRWLPLAALATLSAAAALVLHGVSHAVDELDHELLLGAHSAAASSLGALLLLARRPAQRQSDSA